ncbi:MAG: hypothetical protein AAF845_15040 [Bacteroidota bacterium]
MQTTTSTVPVASNSEPSVIVARGQSCRASPFTSANESKPARAAGVRVRSSIHSRTPVPLPASTTRASSHPTPSASAASTASWKKAIRVSVR